MSDDSQAPWKVITGIAVLAAVALGFLWMQARQGTVDVSVADSLRQQNQELTSTVEKLRAAPPETVYAEPPGQQQTESRMAEVIRSQVTELEAVLPGPETHPTYYEKLGAIRAALDSLSGG